MSAGVRELRSFEERMQLRNSLTPELFFALSAVKYNGEPHGEYCQLPF
jgi:hypothetical protein